MDKITQCISLIIINVIVTLVGAIFIHYADIHFGATVTAFGVSMYWAGFALIAVVLGIALLFALRLLKRWIAKIIKKAIIKFLENNKSELKKIFEQ